MSNRSSNCNSRVRRVLLISVFALASSLAVGQRVGAASTASCAGKGAAALDRLFSGQVGRVVGSDYVRPFELSNGNTLIFMQDVFLAPAKSSRTVASLAKANFAHNAAILLDARGCVVRTLAGGRSYVGSGRTRTLSRWFWAMGGAMGADGNLHVIFAEMRNPKRTGAATGAQPVATWHATIDPATLDVRTFAPASDNSADLYGWAVASDDAFTYLYSHCYRQFIPGEAFGHDPSCSGDVRVARVPHGEFDAVLEYYSDGRWTTDGSLATPLEFPGDRAVNPVSIQNLNGTYVSVAKVGDWWGTTILVDVARSPVGPWTTIRTISPTTKCADCNTYFASLMPWRQANGSLVVALSNNAWDMRGLAYPNPWIYRNSFIEVAVPR